MESPTNIKMTTNPETYNPIILPLPLLPPKMKIDYLTIGNTTTFNSLLVIPMNNFSMSTMTLPLTIEYPTTMIPTFYGPMMTSLTPTMTTIPNSTTTIITVMSLMEKSDNTINDGICDNFNPNHCAPKNNYKIPNAL